MALARRDAWSSVVLIREMQDLAFKVRDDPGNESRLNSYQKKTDDYEHETKQRFRQSFSLFFFEGSVKYIYNDPQMMPLDIRQFFLEEAGNKPLHNYETFTNLQWTVEICEILDIKQEKNSTNEYTYEHIQKRIEQFKNKGYVLTKDNYIKMFQII